MYFSMNYSFLTGKSWVKLFECQAEVLAFTGIKVLAMANSTDRTTFHRSLFQAYEFAMHFQMPLCDVTDYARV